MNDQNRTLEGATNTGHFTHAFSALHRGFVTYRQTVFLLKHSLHKRIGSLVFDIIGHITQHLPFQQRRDATVLLLPSYLFQTAAS